MVESWISCNLQTITGVRVTSGHISGESPGLHVFEPCSSQPSDLKCYTYHFPSQVLSIIRIVQRLVCSVSG